jgi:hypothetical protein
MPKKVSTTACKAQTTKASVEHTPPADVLIGPPARNKITPIDLVTNWWMSHPQNQSTCLPSE